MFPGRDEKVVISEDRRVVLDGGSLGGVCDVPDHYDRRHGLYRP